MIMSTWCHGKSFRPFVKENLLYPINIYYNGAGFIQIPSAEEYKEMFQERLKQKRLREEKTA